MNVILTFARLGVMLCGLAKIGKKSIAVKIMLSTRVINRMERADGTADTFGAVVEKHSYRRRPFAHDLVDKILGVYPHDPRLRPVERI